MNRAWNVVRAHAKLAVSLAVGVLMLAVGGLSVALAAGDGGEERSDRDRFVPGAFHHMAPVPAPALDPEAEAQMEDFHECMSGEGIDPLAPSERPEISEGPPQDLSDAFEKCEEFLPEGAPLPPPGIGPGPGDVVQCEAIPGAQGADRDSDDWDSTEEPSDE